MAKNPAVKISEVLDTAQAVPFLRAAYGYDRDAASLASGLVCGPSLAHQSFKEDCDINTIVRRFGVTGQLPVSARPLMQGDFSDITDYRSAVHAVIAAEEAFLSVPSDLRKRLDNDPQRFLEFCSDPANLPELRKLGLAVPEAAPPPPPVPPPAAGG